MVSTVVVVYHSNTIHKSPHHQLKNNMKSSMSVPLFMIYLVMLCIYVHVCVHIFVSVQKTFLTKLRHITHHTYCITFLCVTLTHNMYSISKPSLLYIYKNAYEWVLIDFEKPVAVANLDTFTSYQPKWIKMRRLYLSITISR